MRGAADEEWRDPQGWQFDTVETYPLDVCVLFELPITLVLDLLGLLGFGLSISSTA